MDRIIKKEKEIFRVKAQRRRKCVKVEMKTRHERERRGKWENEQVWNTNAFHKRETGEE